MANKIAEKNIRSLTQKINSWAKAYYQKDNPIVPDIEYDAALRQLQELEKAYPELIQTDSPSFRVGSAPLKEFKQYQHTQAMLSLNNSYSIEDLMKFEERLLKELTDQESKKLNYIVEEKMDGLALNLKYENGSLITAATRGNGQTGEEVTENAKTIYTVPMIIPHKKTIEVRGEAFISHSAFKKINERLSKENKKPFANPRNAASGSMRLLDSSIVAQRPLGFFAYQIVGENHSQEKTFALLKKWGFTINSNFKKIKSISEISSLIDKYEKIRSNNQLGYDIDGLVIKVNDFNLQNKIGYLSNAPKWAMAYKLSAAEALSTIEDISIQVGRTGALTPVAHLKPTLLSGVTISRATLHNQDQINKKDIRIGDEVWVRRAGDVIPEIVRVQINSKKKRAKPFSLPTQCPRCQSKAQQIKADLYCVNFNCPSQKEERMVHFCSKAAIDIKSLGEKWIIKLVSENFLNTPKDLFLLQNKHEELCQLDGLGEKSLSKIYKNIEDSFKQSDARKLYALGIPHIGKNTAELLLEHYPDLTNTPNITQEQWVEIKGIGPESAEALFNYFNSPQTRKIFDELVELKFISENKSKKQTTQKKSSDYSGKTFVITGSFEQARGDIAEILKSFGAKVSSSISKNTDYLLCGEKAGSKLKKAQDLGTRILGPEHLKNLFKGKL